VCGYDGEPEYEHKKVSGHLRRVYQSSIDIKCDTKQFDVFAKFNEGVSHLNGGEAAERLSPVGGSKAGNFSLG